MSSDARQPRRTKIVATVGPATRSTDSLVALIEAGADVLRLNYSHGTRDEHAETVTCIREASERAGRHVGILGDIPGPKIRLDEIEDGLVRLHSGGELTLTTDECLGTEECLPVSWAGLPAAVKPDEEIYLADGRVRLRVISSSETEVRVAIEAGGAVASHQGVNIPHTEHQPPATSDRDLDWVDFAVETGIDLLAVSFVRSARDLDTVETRLAALGSDIPLIAKIETVRAARESDELVKRATSGIMIARGDLGIELPIASVPVEQKRLLALAGRQAKPAITATQMLASMVTSDRPTRAEVADVANAIYDGTDAVMLSEETAVGEHPIEAVRMMDRIARETEPELPYGDWLFNRVEVEGDVAGSVAQGAVGATYRLGLAAIVVPTTTGRTARIVSALRPRVPVLAISPRQDTAQRLNLLFGVRAVYHAEWEDLRAQLDECAEMAREEGVASSGELIAITGALPDMELGTNLFEIHRVP
ncbi:MAG: pyruvate kinase [Solirubrobacterales bacterium]